MRRGADGSAGGAGQRGSVFDPRGRDSDGNGCCDGLFRRWRRIQARSVELRQRTGIVRDLDIGVDEDDRGQVVGVLAMRNAHRHHGGGGVGDGLGHLRWFGRLLDGSRFRCHRLLGKGFGDGRFGEHRFRFDRQLGRRQRRAVFHQQARKRVERGAAHAALHPALRGVELIRAKAEHAGALRAGGAIAHCLIPDRRTQPSSRAGGSNTNHSR